MQDTAPAEMNINGRVVFADAVVLHSHQPGEGPFTKPGHGTQVHPHSAQDREFIRQFIREEVSRGIVPETEWGASVPLSSSAGRRSLLGDKEDFYSDRVSGRDHV
jgi:hypothetical protein